MMVQAAYPAAPSARIIQGFGNPNPKLYANGRHMGVDIVGAVGSPILAACAGIVHVASLTGGYGYGRHVVIEHGEFFTVYAHLHKVFVVAGQTVEARQLIGEMGGDPRDDDPIDGASTGPHLHFEVTLAQKPEGDCIKVPYGWAVDPLAWLTRRFAPPAEYVGTVLEKEGLRVRATPGVGLAMATLGAVTQGTVLEIVRLMEQGSETWAQLRALRTEWVCVRQGKREYVRLEKVKPGGAAPSEQAARLEEVRRMIAVLQELDGQPEAVARVFEYLAVRVKELE